MSRSAQTVGWIAVLLLAAAFVRLGVWQLDRLEQRRAANEQVALRLGAKTIPLTEALGSPADVEYRRVVTVGEYAPEHELLLRNRSNDGQTGFHVLTPLILTNGHAVLVDRGWVPLAFDSTPVAQLAPPEGRVEVTGVLRSSRQPPAVGPTDPASGVLTQIYWPDLDRLAAQLPWPLEPMYVELRSQIPAAGGPQPVVPEDPQLGNGPHLSYAIQWFSFALIVVIGFAVLRNRKRVR